MPFSDLHTMLYSVLLTVCGALFAWVHLFVTPRLLCLGVVGTARYGVVEGSMNRWRRAALRVRGLALSPSR